MKASRSIVPALLVLTVLVAAAVAIGMMGRSGVTPMSGGGATQPLEGEATRPSGGEVIRPFRTEPVQGRLVGNIAVSPDGQTMATTTWVDAYTQVEGTNRYSSTITGTVSLWRIDGWQYLSSSMSHDYIYGIRFTPDGQSLAVLTEGNVEWVGVPGGEVTRKLTGKFYSVAFSPDWTTIASARAYTEVQLLRADDGTAIRNISGATGSSELAFSPDGQLLAAAGFGSYLSDDYSVQLWRVSDGTPARTVVQEKASSAWSGRIAFSPDGQLLACSDLDGDVRLYQVSDGALLHTLKFTMVEDIAFSPDGKLIAAGSDYDWAKLWRVSDGTLVAELANEESNFGNGGKVLDVEFSPDGKILYGGTLDSTIRMWQVPEWAAR